MNPKVIGVLGGMGPDATVDFFSKLTAADPGEKDQDHLHIIVDSNPSIPDRTAHILGKGKDPLPAMLASARALEAAGAQIAGIPCMTAHHYLPGIRKNSSLVFLSAIEEMSAYLHGAMPGIRRLGILATRGSRTAGIYESNLPGFEIIWPDEETQQSLVMEAIYGSRGIKAGFRDAYPLQLLFEASGMLIRSGAELIVGGCTEVPLVLTAGHLEVPFIDPMLVLAQALIREARRGS